METLKLNKDWLQDNGLYKCPYCNKEYGKKGINTHIFRVHTEIGKSHNSNAGYIKGTRKVWNKGLTKETDERVKIMGKNVSLSIKKMIKEGTYIKRSMGEQAKRKLSLKQSLNNSGGKCKWFNIGNQKVQGTWERDLALKIELLGIKWYKPKVNNDIIEYFFENKRKSYSPDFYIEELDIFLEIKSFWWGNDKLKMEELFKQKPELLLKIKLINLKRLKELLNCLNKKEFLTLIQNYNFTYDLKEE